jgi:hypothetical protein
MIAGMFPAAALAYRRGYIQEAGPVVREERRIDDVLAGVPPVISEESGFDPGRDDGSREILSEAGEIDPLAFLVGPVHTHFNDEPGRTVRADLSRFIETESEVVRSATGEIAFDYGRGACTVNTSRAQGVCGFLSELGEVELAAVKIRCLNEYASVLIVSLDGEPLERSGSVLIQVGTTAHPTGWRTMAENFKPKNATEAVDGEKILDAGRGPWRVEDTRVRVSLANPELDNAVLVDPAGRAVRAVPVTHANGVCEVELPPDSLYVVLQ